MQSLRISWLFLFVAASSWGNKEDLQGKLLAGPFCFTKRQDALCRKQDEEQISGDCVSRSNPSVFYYLFTNDNPTNPEFLHDCGGNLPLNSKFKRDKETKIFFHGWLDGMCRTAVWREMRDQLFYRGEYNVLFLDWTNLNTPDLQVAGQNVKYVANITACVLKNIMNTMNVNGDKFHIIGHSYGGQMAGLVGQQVPGLRRITALDPSGLMFADRPIDERLDASDAKLVDVIHGNLGCLPNLGTQMACGHADFYPDGGVMQKSCVPSMFASFLKLDVLYGAFSLLPNFCSHLQPLQFFKASINACMCQFVGVECESWGKFQAGKCNSCNADGSNCAVMGMDWEYFHDPKDNGTHAYYLSVRPECPYCDNSNIQLNGFTSENKETLNISVKCFPNSQDHNRMSM